MSQPHPTPDRARLEPWRVTVALFLVAVLLAPAYRWAAFLAVALGCGIVLGTGLAVYGILRHEVSQFPAAEDWPDDPHWLL